MNRSVLSLFPLVVMSFTCSAAVSATRSDLVEIFQREKFTLLHHVRDVSERDWTAAGVRPCESGGGHKLSNSIVDPGHAWASEDWMLGPCQLLLVAKNSQHEILSYWERTQGGPMLRVLVLRRQPKPRLFFSAIMHNDISLKRWTWGEIRGHILQGRFDAIMP
jgi:hypothetical protein